MGFFASQGEAGLVAQYLRAYERLTDRWLDHIHAMIPIGEPNQDINPQPFRTVKSDYPQRGSCT